MTDYSFFIFAVINLRSCSIIARNFVLVVYSINKKKIV